MAKNDPTLRTTKKSQNICPLRKEKKFTDKKYFQTYPSDSMSPQLYGTVRTHKAERNYPVRTIVPTIETKLYEISKYFVEIIQPTLDKDNYKVQKDEKNQTNRN